MRSISIGHLFTLRAFHHFAESSGLLGSWPDLLLRTVTVVVPRADDLPGALDRQHGWRPTPARGLSQVLPLALDQDRRAVTPQSRASG
jgi:hypothetical protein